MMGRTCTGYKLLGTEGDTHTLDTGNAQSSDLNYSQLSSYVSRRDLNMKRKMLKLEAPG